MSRRVGFISPHAVLGEPAEVRKPAPIKGYHIADTATVQEFCRVHRGTYRNTMIGPDVWLMAGVHIGHDVVVQEGCEIAPGAVICGEVTIGPWAKIGANATVLPGRVIGQRARVGAGAVVTHDVPPGETWAGNPARRLDASSSAHEHTTRPTPSPPATSTSPASPTPSSAPETPLSATDADAAWWAWVESRDTSARRTTLPKRPPGGFIEASGQHAAKPAPSRGEYIPPPWWVEAMGGEPAEIELAKQLSGCGKAIRGEPCAAKPCCRKRIGFSAAQPPVAKAPK